MDRNLSIRYNKANAIVDFLSLNLVTYRAKYNHRWNTSYTNDYSQLSLRKKLQSVIIFCFFMRFKTNLVKLLPP